MASILESPHCVGLFNVRIGKHIRISSLTEKKVKSKCVTISDHLLLCNHSKSFEMLTKENRTFALELKGSIVIVRDKISLKSKVRYESLHLFDRV